MKLYHIETFGDNDINRAVQNRLFKLGYSWPDVGATYTHLDSTYLRAYKDGRILYGETPNPFKPTDASLITIEQLFALEIIPEYTMQEAIEKMGHEFKIKK